MIRCWKCDRMVATAEPRRPVSLLPGQFSSCTAQCGCGMRYDIRVTSMGQAVKGVKVEESEAEKEKGRLWESKD